MSTGFVYDDRFLLHDTGSSHPERPDRLAAVMRRLRQAGVMERLKLLPMDPATVADLSRVHDADYIERVRQACLDGHDFIDARDSSICAKSYDVACLAAGGVLAAVRAVMRGEIHNAFCAVRPPGHHAEADHSMGFCLFNNVAVAAAALVDEFGLSRVAVVDIDVHHGNGTQHMFEDRDDVMFVSLHEDPSVLYPGTGFATERGRGRGDGLTLNLPLPPHSGDEVYREMFDNRVLPELEHYRPEFILISAGFDALAGDPLAHLRLSQAGHAWLTRQLRHVAEHDCEGRLVSVLEGGYHLDSLAEGVERHIRVLMDDEDEDVGVMI